MTTVPGWRDPCDPQYEYDARLRRIQAAASDAARVNGRKPTPGNTLPGISPEHVDMSLRAKEASILAPSQTIASNDTWQTMVRNFAQSQYGMELLDGKVQPVLDIAPNAVCQRCSEGAILTPANGVTIPLWSPLTAQPVVQNAQEKEFSVNEIIINAHPTIGGSSGGIRILVKRADALLGQNWYTLATVAFATKDGANPIVTNYTVPFPKPIYLSSQFAITATFFNVILGNVGDAMEVDFVTHMTEWDRNTTPGRALKLCTLPEEIE